MKFSGRDLTIQSACFGQRFWELYEFYLRGIRRYDGRFSIRAFGDCIKFSARDKTIRWAYSVRASRDCIKFYGGGCLKFSGRDPTIRLFIFGQSHWRVYKILWVGSDDTIVIGDCIKFSGRDPTILSYFSGRAFGDRINWCGRDPTI